MIERGGPNVVDAQNSVERTAFPFMGEFHAVDVVGCAACLRGDRANLLDRDINELGLRVDKTPDQPGASDTVDLGMFARNPLARRRSDVSSCRQALRGPS